MEFRILVIRLLMFDPDKSNGKNKVTFEMFIIILYSFKEFKRFYLHITNVTYIINLLNINEGQYEI